MKPIEIRISRIMAAFDRFKTLPDEQKNLSVLEADVIDIVEEDL